MAYEFDESRPKQDKHLTIAISYRRADSQEVAVQIYRRLCSEYGRGDVLFDIESIPLGADFRRYIDQTLRSAKVLLAVIGDRWVGSAGHQRIQDEADFVRLELEAAFRREITVIPIFVDGAKLSANELPPSLRDLAFRNGLNVSAADLGVGLDRLVKELDEIISDSGTHYPATTETASLYGEDDGKFGFSYLNEFGRATKNPREKALGAILTNELAEDMMILISGQPVMGEDTYYTIKHLSLTNFGSARVLLLAFTMRRPWWTRNRIKDLKSCDVEMTVDATVSHFRCNILSTRLADWKRYIEVAIDDPERVEAICQIISSGRESLVIFKFVDLDQTASFHFGRIRSAKALEEVLSF